MRVVIFSEEFARSVVTSRPGVNASVRCIDAGTTSIIRHRVVPERVVDSRIVVARPVDGAALVLDRVSALIWVHLDDWNDVGALDAALADAFPAVQDEERRTAIAEVVSRLDDEGLLERRAP